MSPSHAIYLGLSLALRSHDPFEAYHWSTLLPPGKERKKKYISPFGDASGKKVWVLLSALVERFGVSHMQGSFSE